MINLLKVFIVRIKKVKMKDQEVQGGLVPQYRAYLGCVDFCVAPRTWAFLSRSHRHRASRVCYGDFDVRHRTCWCVVEGLLLSICHFYQTF